MNSDRAQAVLHLVAEAYIASAKPVPSSWVAERVGMSPATVRNDFARLEADGLLMQPHTSAGRVPTAEGFKAYAEAFLPPEPLSAADLQRISDRLSGLHGSELLERLALVASNLTGYAVVLDVAADPNLQTLTVHMTPMSDRHLMVVAVFENGLTRKRTLDLSPTPGASVLDDAERTVRDLALPISTMEAALRERARTARSDLQRTLQALADAWPTLKPVERYSHGMHHLLDEPEADDPSFLRQAARQLESTVMPRALAPAQPLALRFDEHVALVSSRIGWRDCRGLLTLVGPTRMRYPSTFQVAHGVGAGAPLDGLSS
jgi:heat-inducible transcriptional repressor